MIGYRNPETNEIHLSISKARNQVMAINQVRIQYPNNFQFYLLERIKELEEIKWQGNRYIQKY